MAALLLVALLARLLGLDSLEPNITADEAERLRLLYQLQAGHGPGFFGVLPDGDPAASLYPALGFLQLFGPSYVALRLSSVFASLLGLVVFYHLARRSLSFFASLGGTALLAFSGWLLFFSRNGLLEIWVLLCALAAAYATRLALEGGRRRAWLLAGVCCGLGWYVPLAGIFVLPAMLPYLLATALLWRPAAKRALTGGAALAALTGAMLLPRLPGLIDGWPRVEQGLRSSSALRGFDAFDAPRILAEQAGLALRSFILLDPTVQLNPRISPPGTPLLDSLSGSLAFVGLFLGLWRARLTAQWWCLLATFVLILPSLSRPAADPARALPGLPILILFAALSVELLIRHPHFGTLARVALSLAIPAAAFLNWQHYVEWQRSPSNAVARQPAVELAEFPAWQELQLAEARAGRPGLSVAEWLQVRDRYRPATGSPESAAEFRIASALEARPLAGFGPVAGLRKPRGVALDPAGLAYVLEADGRLLKLDSAGKTLATFGPASGGPRPDEVSDLALGRDGSLLVLDAGRGLIDRYDPSGRFAASLGGDWALYRPRGLAVGPDGAIYVADTGHNRVVVSNGGPLIRELRDLDQPSDIAIDPRGWIYAIQPDSGRLTLLDQAGRSQATWEVSRGNTIDGPHLAYLEAGALAITDPDEHQLVFRDPNGRELARLGGADEPALALPYAVASAGNRVLVSDLGKPAVRAYELLAR